MDATHVLIERERRAHASRLAAWAQQVRTAPRTEDALRIAAQEPAAGPLIRGLRSLRGADLARARRGIDTDLRHRLDGMVDPRERTACLSHAARLPWAPLIQACDD